MNGNAALEKAAQAIREGKVPHNIGQRMVWLHTAVISAGKKFHKSLGMSKPKPVGAGKWSVAYPARTEGHVVLMSVNKSTGASARLMLKENLPGVMPLLAYEEAKLHNPADDKTCPVYIMHVPLLTPISKQDGEEINYTVDYLWSMARLVTKHGKDEALRRVLEHIALVEYEERKAPRVVRDMFRIMADMYERGYWHTDVWRPNVFRNAKGELTLGDLGAIRTLDKVTWEGRPDPYRGDFITRVSNADVNRQIAELTETGWYPPKAARARARKIRRATERSLKTL